MTYTMVHVNCLKHVIQTLYTRLINDIHNSKHGRHLLINLFTRYQLKFFSLC